MLEVYRGAINPVRRLLYYMPVRGRAQHIVLRNGAQQQTYKLPDKIRKVARTQEVRASSALFRAFRQRMRALLDEVKARGPPAACDVSIAAHLLRLRDPASGQPLSDDILAGEFGVFFAAGIESAGNAMSWTLSATHSPLPEALVEQWLFAP